MLPNRRMEYYLAQLALTVANVQGAKAKISDFLFDIAILKAADSKSAEEGAEIIGAMAGSRKVIRVGLKKKQRAANG